MSDSPCFLQIAPKLYALIGMKNSLIFFVVFLVLTAVSCFV